LVSGVASALSRLPASGLARSLWALSALALAQVRSPGPRQVDTKEGCGPDIVMSERWTDAVMLSERVGTADFDSDHFRAQLVQRLAWAVDDAMQAEQADGGERARASG
jgi:hypothetical protein